MKVGFVYRICNERNLKNGRLAILRDDFHKPLDFYPDTAAFFREACGKILSNLKAMPIDRLNKMANKQMRRMIERNY